MANRQWISLTLAGNSPTQVTVDDLVILKHCQSRISGGTLFYSPIAGAGPYPDNTIVFDLDKSDTEGQYPGSGAANSPPPGGNFFAKVSVALKYHEQQTFTVFISTAHQYCTYTFQLAVATEGGRVTESITDHGQPFALTADGEGGPPYFSLHSHVRFSSYSAVYAGGAADVQRDYKFVRVNPKTYLGDGDPAKFPTAGPN